MLTLKHSKFLAQLLMEELDFAESSPGRSHDHYMFSMRATDSTEGQELAAKPPTNNMPVSWYDVRDIQQVLWAKAEGIGRRTHLNLLKRS